MWYIHECHTPSCSSSWSRPHGESTTCLWNSCSKWQGWLRIRQKSVVWPRLITKSLHGDRRRCYLTKRLRLRMHKLVSSPTRCCLGGISTESVEAWKNKIKWYLETRYLKDLNRIDGEPTEFEWKISPGFHYIGHSREDSKNMTELQCEPRVVPRKDHLHVSVQRHCEGRTRKQNNVRRILSQLRNMFADSRSDVGHFWDLDQRRNGTELTVINQMENGTRLLNEWCSTLQNPVILYFVL